MQTITFRMDEHHGPAVQQRGVCSVSQDEPQWKIILMKKAYINSSGPGNCYLSSQGSRVQKIVTYFNLRRKIKCYAR